jgi:hypothetical protein
LLYVHHLLITSTPKTRASGGTTPAFDDEVKVEADVQGEQQQSFQQSSSTTEVIANGQDEELYA